MRTFSIIFCLFIITFFGCKTEPTSVEKTTKKEVVETLKFPDDFYGIYKGTLLIKNAKGNQEVPMEYHLLKTDSIGKYEYKLVYNGQARNYFLIEKDKKKGIYEVDENNGIVLPTYLNKNTLHSFFEVQGNLLSSRAKFKKNELEFEILFTRLANKVTSGGGDVPDVFGYPITTFQTAILKKVKENN